MKQVVRLSLYDHNYNGKKGDGRLELDWDSVHRTLNDLRFSQRFIFNHALKDTDNGA